MENIKSKRNTPKIGKYFNILAVLSFIIALSFIGVNWSTLPDKVPSHYNLAGEPDNWSGRWFMFVPITIGIILWFSLQILENKPHLHNYSGLTEKNKESLYNNSMLLINFIKNEMLIYFSFSAINDIYAAKGKEIIVGAWDLLIFGVMIIGTIVFFFVRSVRLKNEAF